MDKQIIYNEGVDIPEEVQIEILKKAKKLLLKYKKPKKIIDLLLSTLPLGIYKLQPYEYYLLGVCNAICCARAILMHDITYNCLCLEPDNIISLFNHENASRFANANMSCNGYWWDVYKYPNNKIIRNLAPRIKFIDWMINQLENDIFTRDTLVQ